MTILTPNYERHEQKMISVRHWKSTSNRRSLVVLAFKDLQVRKKQNDCLHTMVIFTAWINITSVQRSALTAYSKQLVVKDRRRRTEK